MTPEEYLTWREALEKIHALTKAGHRLPKHGKSKIANLCAKALRMQAGAGVNLGYWLGGLGDAWGLHIEVDGETIPLAFSKTQALEIARRIHEHYE